MCFNKQFACNICDYRKAQLDIETQFPDREAGYVGENGGPWGKLGGGNQGQVYKVHIASQAQPYALKIIWKKLVFEISAGDGVPGGESAICPA